MSLAAQQPRRQWVSLREAAEYSGYSTKTLRRRIAAGELPAYKLPGNGQTRRIRIDLADLEALLRPIPTGGR